MALIDLCLDADAPEPAGISSRKKPLRIFLVPLALGQKRREILQAGIARLGGDLVTDPGLATHIVSAESVPRERVDALLARLAASPSALLVSCAWIVESLTQDQFVDSTPFLTDRGSVKRLRSESDGTAVPMCISGNTPDGNFKRLKTESDMKVAAKSLSPSPTGRVPDADSQGEHFLAKENSAGVSSIQDDGDDLSLCSSTSCLSTQRSLDSDSQRGHLLATEGSPGRAHSQSSMVLDSCLNCELLQEFDSLRAHYSAKKNERWRETQYRKIVAALKTLPFRIESMEDLKRPEAAVLNGNHTRARVQEFLERGSVELAQTLKQDPRSLAIFDLINFGMHSGRRKYASYVGAATAERWYVSGITSVDELEKRIIADPKFLSHNQKVMWDFRRDFSQRIPRHEVELIADVVRMAFPVSANVEPCGSFRRGAADCGDADLLVCVQENVELALTQAVERLHGQGFITSTLKSLRGGSLDSGQWQGGCCLASVRRTEFANCTRHRRLDIKVYTFKERSFAQLYFGSGEGFNRAVRLLATRKGFALSDRGIRRVTRGKNEKGELVTIWEGPFEHDPSGESWATESSIFSFLGLPFINPCDRTDDMTAAQLESLPLKESSTLQILTPVDSVQFSLPSWRFRGIVALDCEFVGVGRNTIGIGGERNALGRVSVVNYRGDVLLDTFVRVEEPVADFRIHVTGLTQRNLNAGIGFDEARALVLNYVEGRVVVGHSLAHDFKVLSLSSSAVQTRDTHSCKELKVTDSRRSLKALCEQHLGKIIQEGVHCSVEDARAALDLYKHVEDSWDPVCPINDSVQVPTPARSELCKAAAELKGAGKGGNAELAALFQRRAATATAYAREHYMRVSRTLQALPFTVHSVSDLDRPELRCVGKGKIRQALAAEIERQQQSNACTDEPSQTIDLVALDDGG